MDATESLDIASLIPHGDESLLLDGVVDHDCKSTTTCVVVGSQPWLTRSDGSVAPWLGIEYMAQSIAVHEGIIARSEGRKIPLGFLVLVTSFKLHESVLQRGERLEVQTTRVRGRPGLGVLSHTCTLYRSGADSSRDVIAEGRLSISIPKQ